MTDPISTSRWCRQQWCAARRGPALLWQGTLSHGHAPRRTVAWVETGCAGPSAAAPRRGSVVVARQRFGNTLADGPEPDLGTITPPVPQVGRHLVAGEARHGSSLPASTLDLRPVLGPSSRARSTGGRCSCAACAPRAA